MVSNWATLRSGTGWYHWFGLTFVRKVIFSSKPLCSQYLVKFFTTDGWSMAIRKVSLPRKSKKGRQAANVPIPYPPPRVQGCAVVKRGGVGMSSDEKSVYSPVVNPEMPDRWSTRHPPPVL